MEKTGHKFNNHAAWGREKQEAAAALRCGNKVDFTNTRNVIIAALILVLAIGITYSGSIQIGVVSLSGLAVSSIVGILLNAILPGKDYTFEQDDQGATSVDFKV